MAEIIAIVGATCSGKTTLSLKAAELLKAEIISADSRQIYKYLNIGTAKPPALTLKKINHYFIDELYPDEEFNASMFANRANEIIAKLFKNNIVPLVAGGSGLYIKALIDGISETADTNQNLRDELLRLRQKFGNEYLYNELLRIDEFSAKKMLPQNWKRVIRAIEVLKLTGKPIWQHHNEDINKGKFNFHQIGLDWNRDNLYGRIDKRVEQMIEEGLMHEVEMILNLGYSKTINSLNTVGYKEMIECLENKISFDKAVELIKRNTRRYAKRQLTWFSKDKRIKWYKVSSERDLMDIAEQEIQELKK